jgi:hypothetical protein
MNLSIHIHSTWLKHPHELRNQLAVLAALETPFPGSIDPESPDESFYPEDHAPARSQEWDRGDSWEPPLGPRPSTGSSPSPAEADSPPADGRQLLGWASKQVPDMKGTLISFGKKKGLHSKIMSWTPQQVAAAYQYARGRQQQPR